MIELWNRVRTAGEDARLRFLRVLNRFAGSFFLALVAFNQAYPQAIQNSGLPKWALIPGGIIFAMVVEYASRQPKPPA